MESYPETADMLAVGLHEDWRLIPANSPLGRDGHAACRCYRIKSPEGALVLTVQWAQAEQRWEVVNHGKLIGYRPGSRDEVPPTTWADECLAGLSYTLVNGLLQSKWAPGARIENPA